MGSIKNLTNNQILAEQVLIADRFMSRLKGLLGREDLPSSTAMWIHRCNSIHTFFMKFPIDVVYVDRDLKVVAVKKSIPPFRLSGPYLKARSVFEFSGGVTENKIQIGDQLHVGD